MKIEIYSDGSGQTANTDGGYGWVMVIDGIKHSEGSGHCKNVSNNDMELEGAIQGLEAVKCYCQSLPQVLINAALFDTPLPKSAIDVTLVSDSQIVLGWASGAYKFKQEHKIEKYKQLKFLVETLRVDTRWVKGHSGDEHNTRCDKLANDARLCVKENKVAESIVNGNTLIGKKKEGIVCFWAYGKLKVLDLFNNICEDYSREVHGKRGSVLEFREDKLR